MLEIGSLVDGKYKILNKVGQGGMSVVYLAMNEKANKQWAVKEVRKDGIKDFEVVKQGLVAETDILKKLNHPHLPSIIDVIDTEDSFIIIMDYIQGNSLNKALDEYGAQPQEYVIDWAKQLCDVLGYLHTRTPAIIYRDMKPSNVMLKPDGNVTLIDFGTAREFKEKNLADTTCLGTVGYAAPEQFGGMGQTDARTDIYCLGATLYHLVTGKNPCEPPYEIKPIREINPALSSGLERIIKKCTQRDPNDRYQSAAELMYALEHYEEIDDIYRKKQKNKLGLFLAASICTIVFAASSLWGYVSAENKKSENYDVILNGISQMAEDRKIDQYKLAIATDPSRTEAYIGSTDAQGLVQYMIDDGVLDSKEHNILQEIRFGFDVADDKGNITSVKALTEELQAVNPRGYKQICYEIGEAYLFYYSQKAENANYERAYDWFQYVREDYSLASVTCETYECLKNIQKYRKTGQTAKEYEEYQTLWSKVVTLQTNSDAYDDDLKLRVWNSIVDMIRDNAVEFYEVATEADIVKMLNEISDSSRKVTNKILAENVEGLQGNITTTIAKVQSIKTGNNG
ncbi:MAG: serine/threonine protein kinase [Clostridia bacterium]|nr:serine/threonine protein kinase [Clostridia bacterium]